MTDKPQTTKVEYKIGHQIVDGRKLPLTKDQEEWSRRVIVKSLEKSA